MKPLLTILTLAFGLLVLGASAVQFSWDAPGTNAAGYWLMCVQNGKTNLLASSATTNVMAAWPSGSTAFVVATNAMGAVSAPSNVITNAVPPAPVNLRRGK